MHYISGLQRREEKGGVSFYSAFNGRHPRQQASCWVTFWEGPNRKRDLEERRWQTEHLCVKEEKTPVNRIRTKSQGSKEKLSQRSARTWHRVFHEVMSSVSLDHLGGLRSSGSGVGNFFLQRARQEMFVSHMASVTSRWFRHSMKADTGNVYRSGRGCVPLKLSAEIGDGLGLAGACTSVCQPLPRTFALQQVIHRQAPSVSPGSSLEMQNAGPHQAYWIWVCIAATLDSRFWSFPHPRLLRYLLLCLVTYLAGLQYVLNNVQFSTRITTTTTKWDKQRNMKVWI